MLYAGADANQLVSEMPGTSWAKQGKFSHLLTAEKATQHVDVQSSAKKHRREIPQGKSHKRADSGLNLLGDDSGIGENCSQSARKRSRKVRRKRDLSGSLRNQNSPRTPTQLDIRSFLSPKGMENKSSRPEVQYKKSKHLNNGIRKKPRKRILSPSSSSDSAEERIDREGLNGSSNKQGPSASQDEKGTCSSIKRLKKTSPDATEALSKSSSLESIDLPSFRQNLTPNLEKQSSEKLLTTWKTKKPDNARSMKRVRSSLKTSSKSPPVNAPGGGGTPTKKLATVPQSASTDIPIKKKALHLLDHSSHVVCKSSLAKKNRIDHSPQDKNQARNEKASKPNPSSQVKTLFSESTCTTKATKSSKADKVCTDFNKPSSSKSQELNERRQKPRKESHVTDNRDYFRVKTKTPQTTVSKPNKEPGGSGVQRKPLGIHVIRADEKEKKSASKKTLVKCASTDSDDLPFFRKRNQQQKSGKQSEAFKKYGIIVPSIEEMIAEKNHLVSYRQQVEEAQKIEEPLFSWPTLSQKAKFSEPLLDCKDLSLDELTEHFNNNAAFLTDITEGKTFSDRHRRYHDANQWQNKFTVRDLTYNTSTIVFTFNQVDHMASLIEEKFDRDNQKSCYIFQVLLPELCMRIFMSQHGMSRTQAKKYLDMRPVE